MPTYPRPTATPRSHYKFVAFMALLLAVFAACASDATETTSDTAGAQSGTTQAPSDVGETINLKLTVAAGPMANWYQIEIERFKEIRPDVKIAVNAIEGRQWQETFRQIM